MRIPPPTLQVEPDGALTLAKNQPGGLDVAEVSLIVNGSLMLGFVSGSLPFCVNRPVGPIETAVGIGLGITILAAGLAGAIRYYRRIKLGRWRIDGMGIQFHASKGENFGLAWDDVERVWWGREAFRLVASRGQVRLRKDLLADADWKTVRDRVEAELAPRFDLSSPRVRPLTVSSPWGIIAVSVPLGLFTIITCWAATQVFERWAGPVMLGWLLAMGLAMILLILRVRRDAGPPPTAWRTPRPASVGENGREPKKV